MTGNLVEQRRIGTTALQVTTLGLGCAALGNLYEQVSPEDAGATLHAARAAGVNYFDTAPYYGHGLSEQRLGAFLNTGSGPRVTVSSKVGRTLIPVRRGDEGDFGFAAPLANRPVFDYSADAVRAQVEHSMARLGIDEFGMLLIHDIGVMTHGEAHAATLRQAMDEALPTLRSLQQAGVVAAIGIGVNEIDVCLETLAAADIDVILLAGRYTLLEQRALDELLPACEARGVSVIVGGPFNSGALVGGGHYDYGSVPAEVRQRIHGIEAVCRRHGVPTAAAALQFPLAHPAVAAVIPGARSAAEMQANLNHMSRKIPTDLYAELKAEGLLAQGAPTP